MESGVRQNSFFRLPAAGLGGTLLELQPAFERGFNFANDASIKLSGSFADEFGELHRLDALDVDVALLSQPRHAGQCDLVSASR